MRPSIELYTDGSTKPTNPGHGGVGYVLVHSGTGTTKVAGWPMGTNVVATNNWAETQAVVFGLRALKTACDVKLYTDSTYVVHGVRRVLDKNKPLLETNEDAWQALVNTLHTTPHKITVVQLPGHMASKTGERAMLNNLADKLAGYSASTNKRWDGTWDTPEEAYKNRPTKKDLS